MLYYFGTSQKDYGHYYWTCEGRFLSSMRREPVERLKLPFNPEDLIPVIPGWRKEREPRENGDVDYFNIAPYSILYITGSCLDRRPGCKSVFFTKQDLSKKEMVAEVLKSDAAWNLIDAMSFRERIILNLQQL